MENNEDSLQLIADDDDMEAVDNIVRAHPKRLLVRTLSSGASESLGQIDSGFNEGDHVSSCGGEKLLMASTPSVKDNHRPICDDISMRSFVL